MEIEIKTIIKAEEKPSLRAAFEDMTRKLIDDAMKYNDTSNINPELLREIRENVRALGGFL